MIIYRPHRGGLAESMECAKEFETIEDMKKYIVQQNTNDMLGELVSFEDIVLGERTCNDSRIGWRDVRYVMAKRFHTQTFETPQCIGFYATDYDKA